MKPMTAAQYAAHTEKIKEQRPTETVTLKSGSVFELRRPKLSEMVQLGILPQSCVAESLKALREKGKYIPPDDVETRVDGLILKREVVAAACVMPPFNEETAKHFLEEDFEEIYSWSMSHQGVEGAEALKKFRQGRARGTSNRRSHGREIQPTTVSDAPN